MSTPDRSTAPPRHAVFGRWLGMVAAMAFVAFLVDRRPFGLSLERLFPNPVGLTIFGIVSLFIVRWAIERELKAVRVVL